MGRGPYLTTISLRRPPWMRSERSGVRPYPSRPHDPTWDIRSSSGQPSRALYAASGSSPAGSSARRRSSSSRSWPGSSASRSRSIAVDDLAAPVGASSRSNRRAGRSRSCARAAWRRPAGLRASDSASGGSPRSSHEPSGRRISSSRSASSRQRRRDGRPARADELAEDAMRERQRDDHAVAGHAAPALGEVPEQRLQAPVHARELGDRLRRGQPQRALAQAVEQRRGDLRVARHLGREAAVEHGHGQRRQHGPDGVDGQQAGAAGRLPRAHQVARAEQLGADVVRDDELA